MRIKCRVTGVIWMLIFLGGCQVMEKEEAGGMRGITDPFEKACGKSACGNDGTYRADHRKTGDT